MISPSRIILGLGPFVLIGAAYASTYPLPWSGGVERAPVPIREPVSNAELEHTQLVTACETTATVLADRLSPDYHIVSIPPFILVGDVSAQQLREIHAGTLKPIGHALRVSYFDRNPTEPITLVLLSNEAVYRKTSKLLDGASAAGYFGYYRRDHRRVILNLATGHGTLAHEFTHALAHFDFPEMPEWFDEGLAAVHEEATFSSDGNRLIGQTNWRLRQLQSAFAQDRVPTLNDALNGEFRNEGEGLHYAHVRYFCLFLQDQGLLEPFYRKFRSQYEQDPTGTRVLCELTDEPSLDEVDSRFQDWLTEQR